MRSLLAVLVLFAACGDDTTNRPREDAGPIVEDDAAIDAPPPVPVVSVANQTTQENQGTIDMVVSLDIAAPLPVTVSWEATALTAGVNDFVATAGTLTFATGEMQKTVTITVSDDALDENDETFTFTLASPVGATLGATASTVTIEDDEALPDVTIQASNAVFEGNAGTSAVALMITLDTPSGRTVTVDYATANDTATEPSDYVAASGTVTFEPGEVTHDVYFDVLGDTLIESSENFTVTLTNPMNAALGTTASSTVTITPDDVAQFSINDASVTEGNSGTSSMTFTITASGASPQAVTVAYTFSGGTAVGGPDFGLASGTVTFAAGETSKQITASVASDLLDENDETFTAAISIQSGSGQILDGTGVGTILDDDATPTISISDVGITEGNSGGSVGVAFTLTLSAPSGRNVGVTWTRTLNTAGANDVSGVSSAVFSIGAGSTSVQFNTFVVADTADDSDQETFTMTLSNPSNVTIADGTGIGTINDDDPLPTLAILDGSGPEGSPGTFPIPLCRLTVVLTGSTNRVPTFDAASTGGTATPNVDYTSYNAIGQNGLLVGNQCALDAIDENDETIIYTISNPTFATITDATGTFTILNDD